MICNLLILKFKKIWKLQRQDKKGEIEDLMIKLDLLSYY